MLAVTLATAWSRCQAEGMFHHSRDGPSVHPGDRPGGRNGMRRGAA